MSNMGGNQNREARAKEFLPREVRTADEMWTLLTTDVSFKPYNVTTRRRSDNVFALHDFYLRHRISADQSRSFRRQSLRTTGYSQQDKTFMYQYLRTLGLREGCLPALLRKPEGFKNQTYVLWFYIAFGRDPEAKNTRHEKPECCTPAPRKRGRPRGSKSDPVKLAMKKELLKRQDSLGLMDLAQLSKKCRWAEAAFRAKLSKMSNSELVSAFVS